MKKLLVKFIYFQYLDLLNEIKLKSLVWTESCGNDSIW